VFIQRPHEASPVMALSVGRENVRFGSGPAVRGRGSECLDRVAFCRSAFRWLDGTPDIRPGRAWPWGPSVRCALRLEQSTRSRLKRPMANCPISALAGGTGLVKNHGDRLRATCLSVNRNAQ